MVVQRFIAIIVTAFLYGNFKKHFWDVSIMSVERIKMHAE
jgi:hypothetical protein